MRRWWRGSPLNGSATNASTSASASSTECWRAPIATTFASLCWRPSRAVVQVPREGGAHAGDLVRGDLLAVARAADHDAERARARRRRPRRRRSRTAGSRRGRRTSCGAVVDDVVAGGPQVLDERDLELVPGVVGGDVDAHGPILPHRAAAAGVGRAGSPAGRVGTVRRLSRMTRSGIDLTALDPDVRPQDDLYAPRQRPVARDARDPRRPRDGRRVPRAARPGRGAGPRHHRGRAARPPPGDGDGPVEAQGRRAVRVASWTPTRSRPPAPAPLRADLALVDGGDRRGRAAPVRSARCSARAAAGAVGVLGRQRRQGPRRGTSCTSTQCGLGLPDEAYYRDEQYAAVLAAYRPHVARMLRLGGRRRRRRRTPTSSPAGSWPSRRSSPPGTGTSSRTATPTSPTTR